MCFLEKQLTGQLVILLVKGSACNKYSYTHSHILFLVPSSTLAPLKLECRPDALFADHLEFQPCLR